MKSIAPKKHAACELSTPEAFEPDASVTTELKGQKRPRRNRIRILRGDFFLLLLVLFFSLLSSRTYAFQTEPQTTGILEMARDYGMTVVDDPAGRTRVERIVKRIFRVADKEGRADPPVAIVDGKLPNAHATSRYLFVTESLLSLLPDDNEMAIVVGHEVAHLVLGHSRGPSLEGQISSAARSLGFRGDLSTLQDAASRVNEAQADRYGLLYAALAGYDISSATEVFDKVLVSDDDPTHPPKAEREKIFRERLQTALDNVEIFRIGVDYALRGNYPYARQIFDDLLQSDFRSHEVYHNLGTTHHLQAFRYQLPKDSPIAICSVSLELSSGFEPQGSREPAGSARSRGVRDDEDRQKFLENIGKAIQNYKKALESEPDYALASSNLGCAYLHRGEEGDIDEAVGELKHAVKDDPQNPVFANNLAVAYLLQQHKESALAELRRALKLNPEFGPARYNIGLVFEDQNTPASKKEAQSSFAAYLKAKEGGRSANYAARARQRLGLTEQENPTTLAAAAPIKGLPISPGEQLSGALQPKSQMKVIPDYGIELRRFEGWEMLVVMGHDSDAVDQVTLTSDQYRTPENIGVGSSVEEVRKAYGTADSEQVRGSSQILSYVQRGLIFRSRDGRVVSWSVFRVV
jgi:predicted Zn-dependent protease